MKPKDAYEDGKCPDCWTPISEKAEFGDHCPNCNWTFANTENENCLAGMACPKCKSKGPFRIVATCWALVCDDGIEDTTEHEWEDDAACICAHCKHDAKVKDFQKREPDATEPPSHAKNISFEFPQGTKDLDSPVITKREE